MRGSVQGHNTGERDCRNGDVDRLQTACDRVAFLGAAGSVWPNEACDVIAVRQIRKRPAAIPSNGFAFDPSEPDMDRGAGAKQRSAPADGLGGLIGRVGDWLSALAPQLHGGGFRALIWNCGHRERAGARLNEEGERDANNNRAGHRRRRSDHSMSATDTNQKTPGIPRIAS